MTYKTYVETKVDLLFILTSDKKMYLIPRTEIFNKTTLNITKEIEKFEVNI